MLLVPFTDAAVSLTRLTLYPTISDQHLLKEGLSVAFTAIYFRSRTY